MNYKKVAKMFELVSKMPEDFIEQCNDTFDANFTVAYMAERILFILGEGNQSDMELEGPEFYEGTNIEYELHDVCDSILINQHFVNIVIENGSSVPVVDSKKLKMVESWALEEAETTYTVALDAATESLRSKSAEPTIRANLMKIRTELLEREKTEVQR